MVKHNFRMEEVLLQQLNRPTNLEALYIYKLMSENVGALTFWNTVVYYLVTYSNLCYVLYNLNIFWLFFMKRSTKIMQVDGFLCVVNFSFCLERPLMSFCLDLRSVWRISTINVV
jgi:hypothetical protein